MRIKSDADAKLIFLVRIALGAVWLYNGLWLKVISLDSHHLQIVQSVCAHGATNIDPALVLRLIGGCETLLAAGIISGLFYRFVSYFQIAVILLMNVVGSVSGGGAIAHPFGLIISNLPTIMCAILVAIKGPGTWALDFSKPPRTRAEKNVWH